jgi:hypothetical protein
MYTRNQLAFRANSFPCNPLPFLIELTIKLRENGTDYIKTDQAKMYLLTINQLAYGQLATIDTTAENAVPSDPLPLLIELTEKTRDNGTDYIKTDQAKMYLLTINQMAYGQLATIDTIAEFERLSKIVKEPTPVKFFIDRDGNGEVFAFFPNTLECYSHNGQHSTCTLAYVKSCVPAIPEQYEALEKELKSIGYTLFILHLSIF